MPCVMMARQQFEEISNGSNSVQQADKMHIPRRRRLSNISPVHDLHMAVVANQVKMVSEILLNFDGDINGKVKGATALGIALFKHRQDIFLEVMNFHSKTGLLDLNITSRDHLGREEPPIVTAARLRFFTWVDILLEAGADIDGIDLFGHTALWFAVHNRLVSASQDLILKGANVSKTDIYNFTPLYLTLNFQMDKSLIHLLLYSGSNVDSPNLHTSLNSNKNLLSLAVKYGSPDLTLLLLELGVGHHNNGLSISEKLNGSGIRNKSDDFSKSIWQTCSNPMSLQSQCRSVVRDYLSWTYSSNGRLFTFSIRQLPLPNDIKNYILLPQLHDHFQHLFDQQ